MMTLSAKMNEFNSIDPIPSLLSSNTTRPKHQTFMFFLEKANLKYLGTNKDKAKDAGGTYNTLTHRLGSRIQAVKHHK